LKAISPSFLSLFFPRLPIILEVEATLEVIITLREHGTIKAVVLIQDACDKSEAVVMPDIGEAVGISTLTGPTKGMPHAICAPAVASSNALGV
jgi:hypothetical protein